jgi:imidazolonepropionase-like amidohydrolase
MNNKTNCLAAISLAIFTLTANAEKIAVVNGTLINPGKSQIVENATVVIDGDRIAAAGDAKEISAPKDARVVDCKGKFILPGYIDAHVHFFQSGDLYTRPDAVDLTKVRPYADEIAWIKRNLPDTFARYLRSGITSVVDVGGPFWNFEVRKTANATAKAPRVAVAGPLISSVSREKLDLGDPPIVKIDNPEQAREFVRKLAAQNPDLVKIWYIVDKDHPVDSFRPIVRATVEESHARKIRVAVHATELETARAAVEEDADVLVHSVIDKPVDDAFVKLLKDRHTILCPTLVVFERYGRTFANRLNLTPEEKAWGNPEVITTLDVTKLPPDQLPDRIKTALSNPNEALDRIKKVYGVALKNLKSLEDAGVTIAAGTDAGNIGTIHGPALFREFQLMKEAGLTPMQILQCATANAAKLFGGETGAHIGKIDNGNFADLLILNSNPLDDIAHASDIDTVIKNGVLYSIRSLENAGGNSPGANLNALAENYVKLVLAMGKHDADYVDAYYGPPEWKTQSQGKKSLDAIALEAARLREQSAKIPEPRDEMGRLRREYLTKQLSALAARVRIVKGEHLRFDEESQALYDAIAPTLPESHFQEILARLEPKLPGKGALWQRYENWRRAFVIPNEKLDAVFQLAIKACRERTLAHIKLPPGENFTVEYVTNKPWGGYNWYQGNYRSVIQINTDLPTYIDRAIDLAAHEGYPGHHVYNSLLEKNLVRDRGWVEFSVYPLFSPQSLVAEGTANFGGEVVFTKSERLAFEKEVLWPAAGIDPSRAEEFYAVQDLVKKLGYATNEAARRYVNGEIDANAAAAWLQKYALMDEKRAKQATRFIEKYRSYVINYNLGEDMVRSYIEKRGGTATEPEKRWREFEQLLASPRLPSDIR